MDSDERPRVCIVTPAIASANGNGHTAARWQRFLAPVGATRVAMAWDGEPVDILIALYARRSVDSIARFHDHNPRRRPLGLVLTGTDLYRDLPEDAAASHSVKCASALVVLQEAGLARLDVAARAKARAIVQSAPALLAEHRISDAVIARGVFTSVFDLKRKLMRYIRKCSPRVAEVLKEPAAEQVLFIAPNCRLDVAQLTGIHHGMGRAYAPSAVRLTCSGIAQIPRGGGRCAPSRAGAGPTEVIPIHAISTGLRL